MQQNPDTERLREEAQRFIKQGDLRRAELLTLRLTHIAPDTPQILVDLAVIYHETGKFDAAEACFRRARALWPDNPGILSNFSNLLADMDFKDESIALAEKAAESLPGHFSIIKNLANKYRDFKFFDKAYASYIRALEIAPENPDMLFDKGFVSLYLRKDLDEAWKLFEYRLEMKDFKEIEPKEIARWNGRDSLKGKKLLILPEQGYGDTIMATRFLPLLREKCADITLSCDTPLHRLFAKLPVKLEGKDNIRYGDYDFYIYMMSLPPLFEKDWQRWPRPDREAFSIPEESRQKFKWIARRKEQSLRVGIVWSGNEMFSANSKRAVSLDRFHALAAAFPDIQFFSFQKGTPERQINDFGMGTVLRLGHMFEDFADTAAALEHMDFIVMTDSAVAHLAGSTGVPVINLLHYKP